MMAGGGAAAAIPWEERPVGSRAVVWRSSRNPVIPRDLLPRSNSIFNSAIVPFRDGFAGVFRVDDTVRTMDLHVGHSPRRHHLGPRPRTRSCSCPSTPVPRRSRATSSTPTTRG